MEIVILILFALVSIVHSARMFWMCASIRQQKIPVRSSLPKITVIVCAHNELENLKQLAPLLNVQTYDNYEVLLMLDRCTDGSAEWLQSQRLDRVTHHEITQISDSIHPKKKAIVEGIRRASGEWILLTDADCRPTENWISEMATYMEPDKDLVLGISPYSKHPSLLNQFIQYETWITAVNYCAAALCGNAYMGVGRNLAYRKKTFDEIGGFDAMASITGGDDDLLVQRMANRRNVAVCLGKTAHVESIPKQNWRAYFHQKTRHFGVGKHYQPQAKQRELFRWSIHIFFWGLFLSALCFHPIGALLIFLLHYGMMTISFNIVADRLQKRFNPLMLPFVDALYVFMMPLISVRSLLVKRITWK